jgi:hypothetical protein
MNREIDKYISDKAKRHLKTFGKETGLLDNIKSLLAENVSGALGHGAVLTYPDRPYMKWSFKYEFQTPKISKRDNTKTFQEACKMLHRMFARFARDNPDYAADQGLEFAKISSAVNRIIRVQAPMEDRIDAWQTAARRGLLFANRGEAIPLYKGDDRGGWNDRREALHGKKSSKEVKSKPVYRFYQAASVHRNYVLRELLPAHGLIVA